YASAASTGVLNLVGGTTSFQIILRTAELGGGAKTSRVVALSTTNVLLSAETQSIPVSPAAMVKLQLLAPGETAVPGKPPYDYGETAGGRTGAPEEWTAGQRSTVTVRFTDAFWNLVPSHSAVVDLRSQDPKDDAVNPDPKSFMVDGSSETYWTFIQANTSPGWKLRAESGAVLKSTTPALVVNPAGHTRLQVLLPGEVADPGGATGKTAAPPSPWTAGIPYTVTVNAVDDYYNVVTGVSDIVQMDIEHDVYGAPQTVSQPLQSGTTTFTFTLKVATAAGAGYGARFTATNNTTPAVPVAHSEYFTVNSSDAVKLQVLLPGETPLPGSQLGKQGPVGPRTAGQPFPVTVRAVDPYFNLVASEQTEVYLETSDPYDLHPATVPLSAGATVFWPALVTESTVTVTAYSTTSYLVGDSSSVYNGAASPARLHIVLPGESLEQGKCASAGLCLPYTGRPGTAGTPDFSDPGVWPSTAGVSAQARVYLVDEYYNRVRTHPGTQVRLTTAAPAGSYGFYFDPGPVSVSAGLANMNFSLRAAVEGNVVRASESGSANGYAPSDSSTFTVVANNPTRMVVTLPTEVQVNGKNVGAPGRSGGVFIATATLSGCYTAKVYAVDDLYNLVTWTPETVLAAQTSDLNDADPAGPFTLTGGSATINNICPVTARKPSNDPDPDGLVTDARLTVTRVSGAALAAGISSDFTVVPNQADRLQALAPGECTAPGTAGGRGACSPDPQNAAAYFAVQVRVTDVFWNLVSTIPAPVAMSVKATDPNAVLPSSQTVSQPSVNFVVKLTRAQPARIFAYNSEAGASHGALKDSYDAGGGDPLYLPDTETRDIPISPGSADRIILIHHNRGETLNQGATSYALARERTGAEISTATAGSGFGVRVYVTDAYFNVSPGAAVNDTIRVTAPNDTFAATPGFTAQIDAAGWADVSNIVLKLAATGQYLAAAYEGTWPSFDPERKTDPPVNPAGVPPSTFTVVPNAPVGIQLLMPWETARPGTGAYPDGGKLVGSTSTLTSPSIFAGVPFTARTRVVDDYFNTIPEAAGNVYLATSDKFDVSPATSTFNPDGTREMTVTLRTRATDHVIFASNPDGTFGAAGAPNAANRTTQFFTESSAPVRLLVLLPGETEVEGKPAGMDENGQPSPGSPPGKRGSPLTFTIDSSTAVTVSVVDAYYNRVRNTGVNPVVRLETPRDPVGNAAELPAKEMSSGRVSFSPLSGDGLFPKRSMPDYVVVATCTDSSPLIVSSASSADWNVHPGALHHLGFDAISASTGTTGPLPQWTHTVQAGDWFDVRVTAQDRYHNVVSTGVNLTEFSITLEAQPPDPANPNQEPEVLTGQSFTVADKGSQLLVSAFRLKQAGSGRWIRV
ncbi:MAG TPA: hypothetical protein PK523_06315, partial [Elusimicrobiales bacterium]|nr:hypothetical protein [Elusimicrobiales bacterium]